MYLSIIKLLCAGVLLPLPLGDLRTLDGLKKTTIHLRDWRKTRKHLTGYLIYEYLRIWSQDTAICMVRKLSSTQSNQALYWVFSEYSFVRSKRSIKISLCTVMELSESSTVRLGNLDCTSPTNKTRTRPEQLLVALEPLHWVVTYMVICCNIFLSQTQYLLLRHKPFKGVTVQRIDSPRD